MASISLSPARSETLQGLMKQSKISTTPPKGENLDDVARIVSDSIKKNIDSSAKKLPSSIPEIFSTFSNTA